MVRHLCPTTTPLIPVSCLASYLKDYAKVPRLHFKDPLTGHPSPIYFPHFAVMLDRATVIPSLDLHDDESLPARNAALVKSLQVSGSFRIKMSADIDRSKDQYFISHADWIPSRVVHFNAVNVSMVRTNRALLLAHPNKMLTNYRFKTVVLTRCVLVLAVPSIYKSEAVSSDDESEEEEEDDENLHQLDTEYKSCCGTDYFGKVLESIDLIDTVLIKYVSQRIHGPRHNDTTEETLHAFLSSLPKTVTHLGIRNHERASQSAELNFFPFLLECFPI